MNLRLFFTLQVILLSASGCVSTPTTAAYEKILNSWLRQPETSLVSRWGPPASVYEAQDGSRILTYKEQRSATGNAWSVPVGKMVYTQVSTYDYHCTTNFKVKEGLIVGIGWDGNDCTAYESEK